MTKTGFQDALAKRGFKTVPKRPSDTIPCTEQVGQITKGGTYTMRVTVIEDSINVFLADGPDLSHPMLDTATFMTTGRSSAFERALNFIDSYR
jgi:hypothetical protein